MSNLIQAIITIGNCVYMWYLTHADNGMRRPGFWIMLAIQPFYMWTAWVNGQWGVFLAACLFAYYAIRGIRSHFGGGDEQNG